MGGTSTSGSFAKAPHIARMRSPAITKQNRRLFKAKIIYQSSLRWKATNEIYKHHKRKLNGRKESVKLIQGKRGTKERDEFEYELRMELLGRMIKATRKEQNLTQGRTRKVDWRK